MGAIITFSSTVLWENRLKVWYTMPIFRRIWSRGAPFAVISCPSMYTLPAVGRSSRLMQRRNVLFPQPEGPITEMQSPCSMSTWIS